MDWRTNSLRNALEVCHYPQAYRYIAVEIGEFRHNPRRIRSHHATACDLERAFDGFVAWFVRRSEDRGAKCAGTEFDALAHERREGKRSIENRRFVRRCVYGIPRSPLGPRRAAIPRTTRAADRTFDFRQSNRFRKSEVRCAYGPGQQTSSGVRRGRILHAGSDPFRRNTERSKSARSLARIANLLAAGRRVARRICRARGYHQGPAAIWLARVADRFKPALYAPGRSQAEFGRNGSREDERLPLAYFRQSGVSRGEQETPEAAHAWFGRSLLHTRGNPRLDFLCP